LIGRRGRNYCYPIYTTLRRAKFCAYLVFTP